MGWFSIDVAGKGHLVTPLLSAEGIGILHHEFAYPLTSQLIGHHDIFQNSTWCAEVTDVVHNQQGKCADDPVVGKCNMYLVVGIAFHLPIDSFGYVERKYRTIILAELCIQ